MDTDCTLDVDDGVATVRPNGDLDFTSMNLLRTTLTAVAAHSDVREIIVDLSGVSFIDSSVLGLFVGTSRACRTSGIEFGLTRLGPRVVRILELTNLHDALVHPSSPDTAGHQ